MRRTLALAALVTLGSGSPTFAGSIGFQYTIEREHEGSIIETSYLKGFEITDGLRLRVKLHQMSYCYVIMGNPKGGDRLVFPDAGTRRADDLAANEWARIPKSTFLRLGEDPGVERVYIVVASERIPELEQHAAAEKRTVSDTLAFEVRDRYHGEGAYNRGLDGPTVTVKYSSKAPGPVVVVEEIALQALPSQPKPAATKP
jgi:hypothetical protein